MSTTRVGPCYTCCLEGWPLSRTQRNHDISLRDLDAAARGSACTTCSLIRDAVVTFAPVVDAEFRNSGLASSKPELKAVKIACHDFIQVSLRYELLAGEVRQILVPLDIFLDVETIKTVPVPPVGAPARLISRDLPSRLNVSWAANLARTWIRQCDECHPLCRAPSNPHLPTRILDLGIPGVDETVKLKVSGDEHGQYIALSYRWGTVAEGGSTLLTTTTSIADRLKGIPWHDIPQTFRDVIELSRELGIRYLWIDSLCIVQDDEEDWNKEAARMAEVYGNSFLTVAATSAPNNNASLFTERWTQFKIPGSPDTITPRLASKRIIRAASSTETEPDVLVSPAGFVRYGMHMAHAQFMEGDNAQQHAVDSPLLTRAWSFQERLLPHRTLHFHAEEMVWECKMDMRCECGRMDRNPRGFPPSLGKASGLILTTLPSRIWLKSSMNWAMLHPELRPDLAWVWLDLVSEYLQLDLTYETDRLPALSGLAARFAHPELGTYLAGLWEATLPEGLLFQVVPLEGAHCRIRPAEPSPARHPGPADAPTWAWSSIPLGRGTVVSFSDILAVCEIDGQNWARSKHFRLVDSRVDLSTANRFGWTTGAYLTVCGLLGDCSELIGSLVTRPETSK
ncbi:heterokaryon incompatibility protein-domain-containing protein [Echria macrotheca]|uniref:Heterokaryon incompatibility protein-domain-containing protein n=1 Tax=Echria macrotheca TaxID=438768 RepID=A0AAJ0B3F7_9PEZI|nr:heterokaryon incompatibility protein-domain-containing protein [Echria macrotheca]